MTAGRGDVSTRSSEGPSTGSIDAAADRSAWWTVVAGPGVVLVFAALTVPLVVGTLDARFHSPLAAPGYTLFVVLTLVGEAVVPQFTFRLYWPPFLLCSYGLAVVTAGIGRGCLRGLDRVREKPRG